MGLADNAAYYDMRRPDDEGEYPNLGADPLIGSALVDPGLVRVDAPADYKPHSADAICLDIFNDLLLATPYVGVASTGVQTLTTATSAGATVLTVSSTNAVEVGELIYVDSKSDTGDTSIVVSVDSSTQVTVSPPLEHAHDAGVYFGQVWHNATHIFGTGDPNTAGIYGRWLARSITFDPGASVVVLGDSWCEPGAGNDHDDLGTNPRADFNEFRTSITDRYPGTTVHHIPGGSGDDLSEQLDRWASVTALSPTTVVHMSAFMNDLAGLRTIEEVLADLATLTSNCVAADARLVMSGVAPYSADESAALNLKRAVEAFINGITVPAGRSVLVNPTGGNAALTIDGTPGTLTFDGTGNPYLEVAYDAVLDTQDFSIVAWIEPDTTAGAILVASRWETTGSDKVWRLTNSSTQLQFIASPDGSSQHSTATWNHGNSTTGFWVGVMFDADDGAGNRVTSWFDGGNDLAAGPSWGAAAEVDTQAGTGLHEGDAEFQIGTLNDGVSSWHGQLSGVGYYTGLGEGTAPGQGLPIVRVAPADIAAWNTAGLIADAAVLPCLTSPTGTITVVDPDGGITGSGHSAFSLAADESAVIGMVGRIEGADISYFLAGLVSDPAAYILGRLIDSNHVATVDDGPTNVGITDDIPALDESVAVHIVVDRDADLLRHIVTTADGTITEATETIAGLGALTLNTGAQFNIGPLPNALEFVTFDKPDAWDPDPVTNEYIAAGQALLAAPYDPADHPIPRSLQLSRAASRKVTIK